MRKVLQAIPLTASLRVHRHFVVEGRGLGRLGMVDDFVLECLAAWEAECLAVLQLAV